ncbi:MAG: SPOR domain-containing protein [Deltaproteobacteria bacterium]|nr:SPOR domain-containing protein [Deltaproteobacteria bacterium]
MGTPQGKTKLKTISALSIAAFLMAVMLLPSCKKDDATEEVISKRVRIGLQEAGSKAAPSEGGQGADVHTTEAQKAETKPAEPVMETAPLAKPSDAVKALEAPQKPEEKAALKKAEPAIEKKAAEPPKPAVKKTEPAAPQKSGSKAGPVKAQRPEVKVSKAEKAKDARQMWLDKVAKAGKALAKKPYAVNVASFPSLKEAHSLLKSLKASGYIAYTTEFTKEGVKWYRVRVGFYKSREEASKVGDRLESRYNVQSPWIVKPPKEEAAGLIQ